MSDKTIVASESDMGNKTIKRKPEKYIYLQISEDRGNLPVLFSGVQLNNGDTIFDDWSKTEGAEMLRRIFELHTFPRNILAIIETEYVDKIYRDIYYHHYASRHFSQPRNCLRIFLFNNSSGDIDIPDIFSSDVIKDPIGVCVIQPNGIIGRSYWNPKYFLTSEHYVRTAPFSAMLFGHDLTIPAFPYTMQDREATTCAEVTVLNLTAYYSQRYGEYRALFLSDIEEVEAVHSPERVFPSRGMNYSDVARNLSRVGLSPRLYLRKNLYTTEKDIERYLYYYTESGIPFGIAVESSERGMLHSMICIGHGARKSDWAEKSAINYVAKEYNSDGSISLRSCWIANSADAYKTFIVMDDNDIPYQTVQLEAASTTWTFPRAQSGVPTTYAVQQICVPLYKRVFLEVDGAAEVFDSVLLSKWGYQAVMERNNLTEWANIGETASNPLIVRIFLASSRTYFKERLSSFGQMNQDSAEERMVDVYANLFCPRFVWVCELYSTESFKQSKAIGEIVLDATSKRSGSDNGGFDSIILVHYPHYITFRDPNSKHKDLELNGIQLEKWIPFDQFKGNLRDFTKE